MKELEYVNLYGDKISLTGLDSQERALVARLRRRAAAEPAWCDFRNYCIRAVGEFYDKRGNSRKKASQSPVFRIALDLSNRLGIAEGKVRAPDYRSELQNLVVNQFPSRSDFCKASGISSDMLSQVLAGRKDLSLEALTTALDRIGYRVRFVPAPMPKAKVKRTA
jgi:hypothetical protein